MADKRVTMNFKRFKVFGTEQDKEFNAWKEEVRSSGVPVLYDRRNNIYCVNPTMDYEMYYNYCEYLNQSYNEWLHYGYFDMGMVPYLMWPSFMDQSTVLEDMRGIARRVGVELVKVPSVSFLKSAYTSNGTDYWIFREDLLTLCSALSQAVPDVYTFGIKNINDASLSEFLKPLAEISKRHRAQAPEVK